MFYKLKSFVAFFKFLTCQLISRPFGNKLNCFILKGIEQTEAEGINTDVKFQVLSLTLTLSKIRYPIAKVNAFGLSTELNMNDENFVAKGRLSSISVTDMSPHGSLYREK